MKKSKKTLRFFMNPNQSSIYLILTLLLAAFLRLYSLAQQPLVCDEGLIIAPNRIYFQNGILPFRNWHHPPFRYFFLYLFTSLFGQNVFSYRLHSVLFAIGSTYLCYQLTKHFADKKTALLAALLMATDPLHLAFSRLAFEESQLTFFILLSLFLAFKYQRNKNLLILSLLGIASGLGLATKWLFLPIYLFVLAYLTYSAIKEKKFINLFPIITCLILVPISVYLFSFLPWFKRGYTLTDWFYFQLKMADSVTSVKITDYGDIIGFSSSPWFWFIRPTYFPYLYQIQNNIISSVSGFSNPFLWLIFFPCLIFLFLKNEQKETRSFLVGVLLFISPLLLTDRPIYFYSATPITAFISIIFSLSISTLIKKRKRLLPYLKLYTSVSIIYSLLLFPLEIGLPMNYSYYSAILKIYGI